MRSIHRLIIFIIIIVFLPKGMGLSGTLTFWMFFSLFLLFPTFLNLFLMNKIKLDLSNIIFITLLCSIIVSTLMATNGRNTGIRSLLPQFIYFFLPFIAGKYFVRTKNDLFRFLYVMNITAIIISLIALSEFVLQKSFYSYFNFLMINEKTLWENSQSIYYRGTIYRSIASFGQGIYLGVFLCLNLIISILLTFFLKIDYFLKRKRFILIQIFISIPAIIVSQSRTAVISLFFVFFLFFLLNLRKIKLSTVLLILLLIFCSITTIAYFYKNYIDEFLYQNVSGKYSLVNLYGRLDMFSLMYDIVKYDITFWGQKTLFAELIIYTMDITNGFLYQFLLYGILYGVIYIFFWIMVIKEAFKKNHYTKWGYFFFLILIYFFIVDNITTLYFQNEILFFVFAGLSANPFLRIIEN